MSRAASIEFGGTPRYEIVRRLGSGGMGVVYQAKDREQNDEIALKTLLRVDASSILHLKTEFRSLADIVHPNLVMLHELEMHDGQWFFTMALVRGRTLFEYLKEERHLYTVQATLRQLAEGIAALHGMGKLHRDIKPSNVMVDENGRVVILDFGLVTELADPRISRRGPAVGTPWYMAPEQARSSVKPTAAADWYAFGVLLFEALTGRLPIEGNMASVIYKKQMVEPPSARSLATEVPEELDRLCASLLSRDPAGRPSGEEVVARMAEPSLARARRPSRARDFSTPPVTSSIIVGRERELARLREAVRAAKSGKLVVARVSGPSGIGKSSLVRTLLEELAEEKKAMVLQGRCYQRESVPYKAIDSLIDRLTDNWRAMNDAQAWELVPPDVELLARVFPVLKRVQAVERAAPAAAIRDAQEQRQRIFAALKEILRRIATRRLLVISIDDLQWGDADSVAMLGELMTLESGASVLMVLIHRAEDVETSPVLRTLIEESDAIAPVIDVPLAPLTPEEAAALARSLLADSDRTAPINTDEMVEEIVRESRGGPWLVHELVRDVSDSATAEAISPLPTLETVLARRMARLSPEAKRLLEVVALAGRPVPEPVALAVASIASNARDALAVLRAGHLVVTRGSPGKDLLETYHDRVRETVAAKLDDEERRAIHLGLGLALEKLPAPDPQTLLDHFLGAGDRVRSRKYAWEAALRADRALAFEQAAHVYRLAIDLEEDPHLRLELAGKLGEALANAGRGRAAAETFAAAGRDLRRYAPGDDTATQLELRAIEEFLRSGHIDEGIAALLPIARAQGIAMPKSSSLTLFSLGVARAKLKLRGLAFEKRDTASIAREALLKLELCRTAYVGFSLVDPLMSLYFQAQYLLLALEHGEAKSLAIAFTGEAIYHATTGGPRGKTRCRELLETAATLARESGDDYAMATQKFQDGSAAYLSAKFRRAFELHSQAVEILRARCTGVFWEVVSGEALMLSSLAYLGNIGELARRLPDAMRRADERGDRFAATGLRMGPLSIGWLAIDRAEHARVQAVEAMRAWPTRGFHLQHYLQLIALVQADLYLGSGRLAHGRMVDAWPKIQRAQLLRIQSVAIELRHLKARAALAAASEEPLGRARDRLVEIADGEARAIAGDELPFSAPFAAAVRGAIASLRSERTKAIEEIASAREGFARAEMKLYEACARFAGASLRNDEEELAASIDFMRSHHIVRPDRIVAALMPALN